MGEGRIELFLRYPGAVHPTSSQLNLDEEILVTKSNGRMMNRVPESNLSLSWLDELKDIFTFWEEKNPFMDSSDYLTLAQNR